MSKIINSGLDQCTSLNPFNNSNLKQLALNGLMESYCLLSVLYACEACSFRNNSPHSVNIALNKFNFLDKFLTVAWRSPKLLLYYCGTLPIVNTVDERRILFYNKIKCHIAVFCFECWLHSVIVRFKSTIFSVCMDVSIGRIKYHMWKSLTDTIYYLALMFLSCSCVF